ncbi:hypothetical protein [Streptomyces sp. RB17]|uniref:hypothetical protein n=1 Tax=Streptomyces sp. RB17 TaxID=2585197 RepID=UPI0012957C7C|nr:hypothetical protein [Streptomyces sp. RB17]
MVPPYVERDHDGELRSHLGMLAGKGAGVIVVRGDSCTGKTRSVWEAVTAWVPDWQRPGRAAESTAVGPARR